MLASSPNSRAYDVSRDDQRFLMIKRDSATGDQPSALASIVVVLNWFEELKQRVAELEGRMKAILDELPAKTSRN